MIKGINVRAKTIQPLEGNICVNFGFRLGNSFLARPPKVPTMKEKNRQIGIH